MYQPPHFREDRRDVQHALIKTHSLGLLITAGPGGLQANFIPFLIDAQASENGMLRAHLARANPQLRATLDAHAADLGYALLLKKIRGDIENATLADIDQAAWNTVPAVSPLFWSFRVMVGLGFYFIALFAFAFWLASKR